MGYIEETNELQLDFGKIAGMSGQEVIPVAVQNADTNEVILVAYTNEQAMLESVRLRRLVRLEHFAECAVAQGKDIGQ